MGISGGEGDPGVYHLDTGLLFPLVGGDPPATYPHPDEINRLVYGAGEIPTKVVSAPVLGEFQLRLLDLADEGHLSEETVRSQVEELHSLLLDDDRPIHRAGFGGNYDHTMRVAAEIREEDRFISQSDALIIACALCDNDADGIYIVDEVVESAVLTDFADRYNTAIRPPS